MIYNILEIANTHGGDINYVFELLKEFEEFDQDFGIKFQPLKYDCIATPDYTWYPVYQKLFFSKEEWTSIFAEAKKTKDIWVDVFDEYGVDIIADNLADVYGVKMQASVLYNFNVHRGLAALDLSTKKLAINISAYTVEEIKSIATRIEKELNPQQLILQIGFQAYPTQLKDSGLSKLAILKEAFPQYEISYTEHIDGTHPESLEVPAAAALLGAKYIEKHIMHSTLPTEYDHYSSVKIEQYRAYFQRLNNFMGMMEQPFINEAEEQYLAKSIQIPVLNTAKKAGQCLSFEHDLDFKRSNSSGLNVQEVKALLDSYHVLRSDKKAGETLLRSDFKKAKIAVVIACRMKSSRLPEKAIKKIGSLPSVERCIKSALEFDNVNEVILATSTVEQDAILADYTYHKDVVFHQGDPDDVIQRYLDVVQKMKVDIILRVTADCPYVPNEVAQHNLKAHFEAGADYTSAPSAAVGTNIEVINTSALQTVKDHFPSANYSEYMTFYFMNNPKHFRLNIIDLPKELVRDYRLTLDYQEDLDMFNAVEAHFDEKGGQCTLPDIFAFLDANPEVVALNQNLTLVYKTDPKLIETLNQHTTIFEKA